METGAGDGSGLSDAEYVEAGAEIVDSPGEVFGRAELVMKVKEPLAAEWPLLREGQILFTYLHLASSRELTDAVLKSGITGVAYETIERPDGELPLLTPMSEIAGKLAMQEAAPALNVHRGGRGILVGGVPGVAPAEVVVIGCGTVGVNAAKVAMGLGAQVTILDINLDRLRHLDDIMHGRCITAHSDPSTIARAVTYADVLIGGVLIPGALAPKLVTEEMVKTMRPGSVIVDVAIDQGGCVETSVVTSHREPYVEKHGVLHWGVPNMPAAVPRTATLALTNATTPYALRIADLGVDGAAEAFPEMALGVNVRDGEIVHEGVRAAFCV
ncbi:MAG TPA: alanine dehydrogenase [Armatimonadota bacterium]|nr:alanine dehydrogenase [Armatimonadota bacterium]